MKFNNINFENIDLHKNKKIFIKIKKLYHKIIKNKKLMKEYKKFKGDIEGK